MAYLTVWQGDDVQRRVKGVVTWFELGGERQKPDAVTA
ncbi:ybl66 [Escherichia coli]|uniref:Ybl66 n=1 Tax=Escherichia coli TaxID=562 RepID=A0A2X3K9W6_ECOLX|nr:ybl66 [Escherichia coli]